MYRSRAGRAHGDRSWWAYEIEIVDTGVGIKPEDLPSIFDEFHQVDSAASSRREGTGLGLSIVRRSVELLGGSAEATSEVGAGSAFTVRIRDYQPADRQEKNAP